MGVWVGGHPPTKFSYVSKDAQENFTSFDTNDVTVNDSGNMVLNEKTNQKFQISGWKLRGLSSNQINL